ncbi:MAG: hypothetical protein IKY83_10710 [Proteobacteria bacterium]|nr:hypothetical protein [Pseudomonadota bacterium]
MKKLTIAICVLAGFAVTACCPCEDEGQCVTCGNHICDKDYGETVSNCPEDCGGAVVCNNDGNIDPGEACDGYNFGSETCATILGAGCTGTLRCTPLCGIDSGDCVCPPSSAVCGNGICESGENITTCSLDCRMPQPGAVCGDGSCDKDNGESVNSCPEDCGGTVVCNNDGNIDLGEACDGFNFGAATCATILGAGCTGTLKCTSQCGIDSSGCVCQSKPICGDGKIDAGEECDGNNLGGATCSAVGKCGKPTCKQCKIDMNSCSACNTCGNGKIDAGEECDGANLGGATCSAVGKCGQPTCNQCMIDMNSCTACNTCGNGKIDAGVECDGTNLGAATCSTVGKCGKPTCKQCKIDMNSCTACSTCGDGKIDAGEECDGDNFGGATCGAMGKCGKPTCNKCKISLSSCTACSTCGNGKVDPGEECDGSDDCLPDCTKVVSSQGKCGDNVISLGETCDKNNFGYYTSMDPKKFCELFGVANSSSTKIVCSDKCQIDLAKSCPPIPKTCGNGKLDPGEFCDGKLIANGYTCQSILGPGSTGTLKCDETCLHTDKSGCSAPSTCGDGKKNGNENCDIKDTNTENFLCSKSYSGSTGQRKCDSICRWDDSGCHIPSTCGNGVKDPGEQCDPHEFVSYATSCANAMGPGSTGYVLCTDQCKFSYTNCSQSTACGNNKTENSSTGTNYHEVCDGTDLNGKTCAKLLGSGYTGTLKCLSNCSGYDYTNCKAK